MSLPLPQIMSHPQQLSPQSQSAGAVQETSTVEHPSPSPDKNFLIRFITPNNQKPIHATARYHGSTSRIRDEILEDLGVTAENGRATLHWTHLNHDAKTRRDTFDVVANKYLEKTDVEFCRLEADAANVRSAPVNHPRPTERDVRVPTNQDRRVDVQRQHNIPATVLAGLWRYMWPFVRSELFLWWFAGPNTSWASWLVLAAFTATVVLINTGLSNGFADQAWGPVRRHIENLVPLNGGENIVASAGREQSASPSETSKDSDSSWEERMLERLMTGHERIMTGHERIMTAYEDIQSRKRGH